MKSAIIWLLLFCSFISTGQSIDCYKCKSVDGNNRLCEDPFHNNGSVDLLQSPCFGGRKGRAGLFPATSCIKIIGRYVDNGSTITMRNCALDSGTLTIDTELTRTSHCGRFYFEDRYVKGCVQSCDDVDACNASSKHGLSQILLFTSIFYSFIARCFYRTFRFP